MSRQGPQESFVAFHRLCLQLGAVTLGIEIKVWRDRRSDPLAAGLVQLERYLARLGLESGWLVILIGSPLSILNYAPLPEPLILVLFG